MRSHVKMNLLFCLVLGLALFGWAFRSDLQDWVSHFSELDIHDLALEDMLGYEKHVQPSTRGLVVFYADLEGCTSCLDKLGHLKDIQKEFTNVGYYAILRGREQRQRFGDLMLQYQFPGELLLDPDTKIGSQMGLTKHPMLMFFDRNSRLIAAMPLDVEHDDLVRQYFRYMEEM